MGGRQSATDVLHCAVAPRIWAAKQPFMRVSFNSQALFTFFVNDKMECALTQQHKIENTYDHQFGLDVTILVVVCIVFFKTFLRVAAVLDCSHWFNYS